MTKHSSRAALIALLLATSGMTFASIAHAQEATSSGDGDRTGRAAREAAEAKKNTAPAGPSVSPDVGKALNKALDAVKAGKYQDALAPLKDAQAAIKTDYDKVATNQILFIADHSLKDDAGATVAAEAAADAAINVPTIDAGQKHDIFTNGAIMALNAGHADKAATYAKQLQALGINDPRTQQVIGQALYQGDPAAAAAYAQQQVQTAIAAGQVPPRASLDLLLNAQAKAHDEAGAEKTLETTIQYYNDPKDWQALIDVAISQPNVRDLDVIYLGRLLFALGVPVSKQNADMVGQTAAHQAYYGDAQNAQAKGGTGFNVDLARISADKASMPQQIAAGAKQNGLYNIKLAEALYSYGMYPQAEAAAKLAQAKGGVADPSEIGIVLGQAQAAQGKYADAVASFQGVTGGGPATARIARLWALYAKNKLTPPGGATPATASAATAAH